jgi:hypothetical protein
MQHGKRLTWGKVDGDEEHAACVWAVCWAHDGCLPVKQIIAYGAS